MNFGKMRFLLIVLLTFILTKSFGQTISGRVVDESTGEALEYVNIRVASSNIGTVSLRNGEFILNIPNVSKKDTVRFTYIGYKTVSHLVDFFYPTTQQVIKLKPEPHILDEVIVVAKSETQILGNPKVGRRYTGWGDFKSLRGRIRGLLIEGAECPVKVKSVSFRINHNEWDSVAFRINMFEVEGNMPRKSLLKENLFVTTDKKHKWVKVDLNNRNIAICKRTVVTVEWVDAWGKTGEYSNLLTLSLGKNSGFLFSQEPGEELGTLSQEKFPPAIFLEVYKD
jgi:hypothetical protein